jgi:YD repeat-containing protein
MPFGRTTEERSVTRKRGGKDVSIRTGTGILDWKPESLPRSMRSRATREAARVVRNVGISKKRSSQEAKEKAKRHRVKKAQGNRNIVGDGRKLRWRYDGARFRRGEKRRKRRETKVEGGVGFVGRQQPHGESGFRVLAESTRFHRYYDNDTTTKNDVGLSRWLLVIQESRFNLWPSISPSGHLLHAQLQQPRQYSPAMHFQALCTNTRLPTKHIVQQLSGGIPWLSMPWPRPGDSHHRPRSRSHQLDARAPCFDSPNQPHCGRH